MMKLQKTLVYFNTSIRGNEVMVGKLQSIFQEKDYQNRDFRDGGAVGHEVGYLNVEGDIHLFACLGQRHEVMGVEGIY